MKVSKNQVVCARCHLVGLASSIGLDDLVLGAQGQRQLRGETARGAQAVVKRLGMGG